MTTRAARIAQATAPGAAFGVLVPASDQELHVLSYPSGMTVSSRALDHARRRATPPPQPAGDPLAQALAPAARPCWWWPTCARARPTPIWPAGSGSAPRRCTGTSARRIDAARRDGPDPGAGDRGRPPQGVRDPRRHPAADRPGRHDQRATTGPSTPANTSATALNVQVIADPAGRLVWISPDAARRPPRHGRRPRARDHRRAHRRRDPRGRRHRLPGRRPDGRGAAAAAPPRPRHRPLPAPVAQPEGGQHRPRPPTRPGRAGQRRAEELADPGGGVRVRDGDHELDAHQYDIGHDERNSSPTATPTTTGGVAVGAGVGVGSGADEALARPATRAAVPTTSRRATTQAAAPKPAAPKTTPKKTTEKRAAAYYKNCAAVRAAGKAPPGEASPGTRRTSTATTTGSAASRSSPSRRAASVPSGAVRSTVRSSGQARSAGGRVVALREIDGVARPTILEICPPVEGMHLPSR